MKLSTFLKTVIAGIFILMNIMPAFADNINEMPQDRYEKVSRGGLLYDNWYKVLDLKTSGTHPSYPPEGKKTGDSTWRCKECHGWDYKGSDGVYSKGSHYTGIKGIRDFTGRTPAEITDILKGRLHGFGDALPEEAYEAISYFVAYGQVNTDNYIDPSSGKASGDPVSGARIYSATCSRCHGSDGRSINFKTPEKPEFLGTLANKNPWETLHKIRFGQPLTKMISLQFLDTQKQIDVLSYCQTLPVN